MGYERCAIAAVLVLLTSVPAAGGGIPAGSGKIAAPRAAIPRDAGTWSRDPFLLKKDAGRKLSPLTVKLLPAGPRPDVSVQGIMKVDGNYFALINGRVVKAGDRIDRMLVEKISRSRVVTKDDSGRRNIDIYTGETPKR